MNNEPLAYFITWTVYGTHLSGDERGWRKRGKDFCEPRPKLANWHQERLIHPVKLMSESDRKTANQAITDICQFRGWKLWAVNLRSNHVHVVVSASGYAGDVARDQIKAKCTRELRSVNPTFQDRPVWTRGGDWQCIDIEDDLEECVRYVTEAQDRKGFND